jgi:hypothetical protein
MSVDATVIDTRLTAQGHRQAALEDARMAEFVYVAKTDMARAFVKSLTGLTIDHETANSPRKRTRQQKSHATFQGSVGAFAADLVLNHQNVASEGFMYRLVDKEAMGQTLVTVRSFEQLREFWQDMGLLEATSFIYAQDAFEDGDPLRSFFGRSSRYLATRSLLEIAAQYQIVPSNLKEHFTKEIGRIAVVQVRGERSSVYGKRGQPVTLKVKGPRYEEEVSRVNEINGYLAKGEFDLTDLPWVYRSFSRGHTPGFDFDQGGRLYCRSDDNWQKMSSNERSRITCNGGPTVELDVRTSHMFILYALYPAFLVPEGDHYSIDGIERVVVKGLITVILGLGRAPKRWPKRFGEEHQLSVESLTNTYKLKNVLDLVYAKHPVLRKIEKEVMDWGKLQFEEADCFTETLLKLGRHHGIAALPVHDSLIVALDCPHRVVRVEC